MNFRQYTVRGTMKISRDDMTLLRANRKKCTVRRGTISVEGEELQMTDGRATEKVRILKVDNSKRFIDLSDAEAIEEGFRDKAELLADLRRFYPRIADEESVTVIYFERIEVTRSLF